MYRNAMKQLLAWKDSPSCKPLVIHGARQVGKTWLVRAFAEDEFDAIAHVVFLDNEEMQRAFEGSLNPDRLLTIVGAATDTNPRDGRTLVFFDEIQECPRAITSLKMFCEQCPQVPVVAAGSLLGVAMRRRAGEEGDGVSWPVGKVDHLNLYPMTFDEFVREVANPSLADIVRASDDDMLSAFSERLGDLLKVYCCVGGMPEAVQRYSDTEDFAQARAVQTALLRDYELDFSKHVSSPRDVERIRQTWRSVPVQLAHEGDMRRFVYAAIAPQGRGRDYRDAVSWLVDAGLVTKVPRVSKPGRPLAAYADETYFKLYLLDVGLLGAATNLDPALIVSGDRLFCEYKGVYAEQYVCQQLVASDIVPYYWSADGRQAKGEIDFLVEQGGGLCPIEVKAGTSVTGSSLSAFVRRYGLEHAVRFSMRGTMRQDWLTNHPLFCNIGAAVRDAC